MFTVHVNVKYEKKKGKEEGNNGTFVIFAGIIGMVKWKYVGLIAKWNEMKNKILNFWDCERYES